MTDGTQVTLTVDLTIPASQVVSVVYTLHAPTNVAFSQVIYSADDLAGKESVVALSDSHDDKFHVSVVVSELPSGPAAPGGLGGHSGPGGLGTPAGPDSVLLSGLNNDKLVTKTGVIGPPIDIVLSSHK